ncbi:multidrug resistance protein 1-like [Sergentomyia squamirostris]
MRPSFKDDIVSGKLSKKEPPSSGLLDLFRFATNTEIFLTLVMLFLVFIVSGGHPISTLLYAESLAIMIDRSTSPTTTVNTYLLPLFGGGVRLTNATYDERMEALKDDVMACFIFNTVIVIIMVTVISIAIYVMNRLALRQTMRIRGVFFKAILSQDMTWYDSTSGLDFGSKFTTNLDVLKDAIGEKLVTTVLLLAAFIFHLVICFISGWKLTLVIGGGYTVLIVGCAFFVGKFEHRLTEQEMGSYSVAGSIAEEVFNSIRTVISFGGEQKESKRYAESLKVAEKSGIRKSFFTGLQSGLMWFLVFCGFGLSFFYGIHLMVVDFDLPESERVYTSVAIITIVLCMVNGSQFVTFTIPSLETIVTAKGMTTAIYEVIDHKSKINPFSEDGQKIENFTGDIVFNDVRFHYPSRKDVKILKGVSFEVKKGQTLALVGSSGSGKSTCLQLVQRLYDPLEGKVLVDGVNIANVNIAFLRSQIGVVGQEPVLFSATIGENIKFGHPKATQEDIENAAKIANCHNFIQRLPLGYDTYIGENGAQLSGGQKQRIAIARAIVRNPKILLLDEATSALDTQSEAIVQKALDKAAEGRTTLIVSHRLSTIRNADEIVVFNQGVIVERGTHDELMSVKGTYYKLRTADREIAATTSETEDSPDEKIQCEMLNSAAANDLEMRKDSRQSSTSREADPKKNTMNRILKLSFGEWKLMILGCFCAIIVGASFPISGVFYAKYFDVFETTDKSEIYAISTKYTIYTLILAAVTGLAALVQTFAFGKAGVRLTSLLRKWYFEAAMRQEIAWYDVPDNSVGALTARLSSDCANVQGATGVRLAGILQATAAVLIGIVIGLLVYWKYALILCVSIPILLAVAVFESQYAKSSAAKQKTAMENASRIAVEAIMNIRTVASLGQETKVLEKFNHQVSEAKRMANKSSKYRGLAYSLNFTMSILTYGFAFLTGGYMITEGSVKYIDVIMIIESLLYGAWMMGVVLNYSPNVSLAIASAENILKMLDRKPQITDGAIPIQDKTDVSGSVKFRKVKFRYPTRPETEILRGLNLRVTQGKTVALVGPSGCGKSTCIQLLQRFYDPDEGRVELDGKATVDFPLQRLRSHLGLVSQEPVLFDRTIAENIAYGDNSREVSMEEIITAAQEARIHSEFVTKLPLGYETPLGSRGTQLSGGQKQRIAIARALVRKPKILLLDEATSALDAESEKTVQAALDKASEQRTCIVIAHRLSSIRNADLICVIDRGQIVEQGNHDELIASNGLYTKLYQLSM